MLSKPVILSFCIDDETREKLTGSLHEYQLHLSNSVLTAISLVDEVHPALILLEMKHGADASAMMLCRQLRALTIIPLLILGPREEGTLIRAFYEGANDYLFLPVNMSELRARISAQRVLLMRTRKETGRSLRWRVPMALSSYNANSSEYG